LALVAPTHVFAVHERTRRQGAHLAAGKAKRRVHRIDGAGLLVEGRVREYGYGNAADNWDSMKKEGKPEIAEQGWKPCRRGLRRSRAIAEAGSHYSYAVVSLDRVAQPVYRSAIRERIAVDQRDIAPLRKGHTEVVRFREAQV